MSFVLHNLSFWSPMKQDGNVQVGVTLKAQKAKSYMLRDFLFMTKHPMGGFRACKTLEKFGFSSLGHMEAFF